MFFCWRRNGYDNVQHGNFSSSFLLFFFYLFLFLFLLLLFFFWSCSSSGLATGREVYKGFLDYRRRMADDGWWCVWWMMDGGWRIWCDVMWCLVSASASLISLNNFFPFFFLSSSFFSLIIFFFLFFPRLHTICAICAGCRVAIVMDARLCEGSLPRVSFVKKIKMGSVGGDGWVLGIG